MEGSRTHLIYVLYPPTSDGRLTSPVMRSVRACTSLTIVRFTELYTAKNRATPLHVIGTGAAGRAGGAGGGTTGRETFTEGRFANGDVVMSEEAQTFKIQERDMRAYEVARQVAQATNGSVSADKARLLAEATCSSTAGGIYTHKPINPHVRTVDDVALATPPYQTNSLVLPGGQQMFPGPQSESLATLDRYIEWQKEELSATWEMPPQILQPQGSKYASDEQLVMRKWEEKLQWYLAHMSRFVSEIYSAAHYKGGRRFAKLVAKSLNEDRDVLDYKGEKYGVELEKEKAAQFETPEIAAADKLLTERKRKKMRDKIRSSLRVEATFHHSYTVDPAIAVQLHGLNGIDDNTLISVLGSAAGIPRNRLLLTQEERDDQKAKRDTEQRESMLATMPPPDAAGPPMKKPAAKPAGKFGGSKDK